ncbi:MAG TPA: energy transducer TonB, partial [Spirochaetia bacterium]|nr:energy transducer TonB [Spirochaetia bacterium]
DTDPSRGAFGPGSGTAPESEDATASGTPAYREARRAFLARLADAQTYPRAAREMGIQGRVDLEVHLDRNGRLIDLSTVGSSSSDLLDEAARRLVRDVLPFPHGLSGDFVVRISIAYTLKKAAPGLP